MIKNTLMKRAPMKDTLMKKALAQKIQMKKLGSRKGFTLIEIIIVLAIIGILAAVITPTYFGYVENSKASACAALRGEVKNALLYEQTSKGLGQDELQAFSDAGGFVCPKTKEAYVITVDADNSITVSCSSHGETKNYGMGEGVSQFQFKPALMQTMQDTVEAMEKYSKPIKEIDSTSTKGDFAAKMKEIMGAQKINPETSNIKTWAIRNSGSNVSELFWSEADISTLEVGSKVLTMRYNSVRDTYTVVYTTVKSKTENGETYNVLNTDIKSQKNAGGWEEYKSGTVNQNNSKKSFDDSYKMYEKIKTEANLVVGTE